MSKKLNWSKDKAKSLVRKRASQYAETEARRKRNHERAVQALRKSDAALTAIKIEMRPLVDTTIISKAETITPDLAMLWLDGQVHNRPLNHSKAITYANDMAANRWDLNGETVIFDWDGVLQDGQHRLWACIESKTPFVTMVTRGVDPVTFRTIDTGRHRRASDVLSIENYKDTTALAAASTIVLDYQSGSVRGKAKCSATNREVLTFVKENPDFHEWVVKAKKPPTIGVATTLAAVCYLGHKMYPTQAEEFLHSFKTGQDLHSGSPILAARNRIVGDKGLHRAERVELVIRAWNAFVEGRQILVAKTAPTQPFPTIKGYFGI
jgi:hypothetical protein